MTMTTAPEAAGHYLLSIGRAQRTATQRLHTSTRTLSGHPTPRSSNGEGATHHP